MGITGYVCPANTFGRSIPSYGLMLESYCDKVRQLGRGLELLHRSLPGGDRRPAANSTAQQITSSTEAKSFGRCA